MVSYKFLEHTADIKFQAFGKSLEEVFENSAIALKETISGDRVKKNIRKKIFVEGKDFEELLYNFLEEFLVLFDGGGFILSKIDRLGIVGKGEGYELEAVVSGDSKGLGERDYEISNHIKAITYSEMFVKNEKKSGSMEKESWISQVVVDV